MSKIITQANKTTRYFTRLFIIIFSVFLISSCIRFQPIQKPQTQQIPSNLSSKQIDTIIKSSCIKRGWSVKEKDSNTIIANYVKNSFYSATIQIDHSNKQYTIKYLKSKNLLNDDGTIHRNYNKWVILLNQDIRNNLNKLSAKLYDKTIK